MDSNNKLTVKQQRQLQERERNKAKRKLGGNVNGEELEEAVINTRIQKSIDQILQFFPKRFPPPPTPSSSSSFLKAKPSNLPFTTLKRHVSWLDTITQSATSPLSLGEEIVKFAQYISLKDEETACRHEIVKEIGDIVQTKWPPPVKVQTFGSFYSGLSIFLSDVDITILGLGLEKETHEAIYNSNSSSSGGGGYSNGDNALTTTTTSPRIDHHVFFKVAVEAELKKSMGSSSSSQTAADILYNIDDTDESDMECSAKTGGQNQKQATAADGVVYDEDGDVIMDGDEGFDDYYAQQEEGSNNGGSDYSNNDRNGSRDNSNDNNISDMNQDGSENSSNIDNIEWHLDTTGENNITNINSSSSRSSIGNCTNNDCLQDVVVRDDDELCVDHIDNVRLDYQHQTIEDNDDNDGDDDYNDRYDIDEYNNTTQTKKFKPSSSSSYQNTSHQHHTTLVSQQIINDYNIYMNKLAADRAYEMLINCSFVGDHSNKSTPHLQSSSINKKSTSSSIADTSTSITAATAITSSSSSNTTAEVILPPLQQQALPIFAKPVIRFMPPPTAAIDVTKSSSVQTVKFKHQAPPSSSAMLSSSLSSSLSQPQQTQSLPQQSQQQRMNDLNDNSDDEYNLSEDSDDYDDDYETCSDGEDDDDTNNDIHDNHFDPEFLNSITTSSLIHISTNENSNITPHRHSIRSSSNTSSSGFNNKGRTDRLYLSKRDEEQIKLEQVQKLGVIYKHLQGMDYVKEMELRRRAKVLIISMIHGNQIGVDISCGVLSKDTTDLVVKLLTYSGGLALFVPISCLLKIFLHQFGLDEPYLGGIGSFKLYVMIAYIVDIIGCCDSYDNSSSNSLSSSSSLVVNYDYDHIAKIFLAFFKHFGMRKHLNTDTVLSVFNTEVTFETCRLIESCQQAFHKAYTILAMAMEKYNESKTNQHDTRYHNKNNSNNNSSKTNHQVTNSILSLIIYAEELQKKREESLRSCRLYAPQTDTEKNKIAENILNQLYNKVINQQKSSGSGNNSVNSSSSPKLLTKLTVENIATVNPLLLLKLKSYRNVEKFFIPFQTTNRPNNNIINGSSGSSSSRVNMTNISRNSKNVLKRSSTTDSSNNYVKFTTQLSSSRSTSSNKKSRLNNDTLTVSSSSTVFNNTATHSTSPSPTKVQPVPVATFSRGGVIGSAFQILHNYQQQAQQQSQQQQVYSNTSTSRTRTSATIGKRKWNEYKRTTQTDDENNSSNTNNAKSSSSSSFPYAKTDIRHGGESQKNLSHLKESIIKSKLLLLANKKRYTKGSSSNNRSDEYE